MHDIAQLAIVGLGVLATSFLSGIFGMAGGMVLLGILVAIMPLSAAMALHGVAQTASNGCRAWLWREHIRWGLAARYAAGSLVAVAAFALLAIRPTKAEALVILGLTPFVGLSLPARARLDVVRPGQGVLCGAVCTAMQLLAGVSGPILDVFFVHCGLDRRSIVATKAAVQTLGHSLKLAYFGALLSLDGAALEPLGVASAVALALVGTTASRAALDAMTDASFAKWSRRLIVSIAVGYLLQGGLLLMREARDARAHCTPPACPSTTMLALIARTVD